MQGVSCRWGCDLCQTACPMNRGAEHTPISFFREGIVSRWTPSLLEEENWRERAFSWRGKEVLLRNFGEKTEKKEKRPSKTTLKAIYEHYMSSGEANSKATTTIAKQNSMWKNHISKKFGDKELKNITLADLQNYLHDLYDKGDEYNEFKCGYEYAYVEGFLRFFYLLFGYAYRLDKIEYERYIKMFVDKKTRLTMPKMTQADFEDDESPVETYNDYQIYQMLYIIQDFQLK